MLNVVNLMGRLTADADIKTFTTKDGKDGKVANFTLAVDKRVAKGAEKKAAFIPCKAFNGTADVISKYFGKGRQIIVLGEIGQENWTDKEGNNRNRLIVEVRSIEFTGEPKKDADGEQSAAAPQPAAAPAQPAYDTGMDGFVEINSDDDLPF